MTENEVREECAKIADHMFHYYTAKHMDSLVAEDGLHGHWSIGMASASKIATAIRATLDQRNMTMSEEPIEEQICRVMADFRLRRMREMVNCSESITDESKLSPELSRHAEAAAIARLFPPTPAKAPPPALTPHTRTSGE